MKEVRDIKLDLLMGNQNPIVDIFNEITNGIRIITCDVYSNDGLEFIYWKVIDDKPQWVFYQDAINDKFWCNYFTYWKLFSTKFKLEYEEIQDITTIANNSFAIAKLSGVLLRYTLDSSLPLLFLNVKVT